jgi:Cation transporter/ATPase, N-terminus
MKAQAQSNEILRKPTEVLFEELGSGHQGISHEEAQKRLSEYGPNAIEEKKENLFFKFLLYFWGPIPWMIEAAAVLSIIYNWPWQATSPCSWFEQRSRFYLNPIRHRSSSLPSCPPKSLRCSSWDLVFSSPLSPGPRSASSGDTASFGYLLKIGPRSTFTGIWK